MLVARDNFDKGGRLCLRWRGPRRVVKTLNAFVYQVEDLYNSTRSELHSSRLRFYHDAFLDDRDLMPHILAPETRMQV